jgi:ABC-type Fe3+/spermidine/putrescine transport system ATPase subunit
VVALRGVSLVLPIRGYTCVMGASGSGKTTLLRVVAGLERPDGGEVLLAGRSLTDVPAERRPVHTLFQGYALFPHLSVWDNVAFAPRLTRLLTRLPEVQLRALVDALLRDVGIPEGLYGRPPAALSGGERQRVALARALAGRPQMLLLDEPLAALDRPLRAGLRQLLKETQREREIGFLHVTHEPEEAMALADHLVLMAHGEVLAQGVPAALYASPPDLASARLLGDLTPVPGESGRWLRPERLRISAGLEDRYEDERAARATIVALACLGDRWETQLAADGQRLLVRGLAAPAAGAGGDGHAALARGRRAGARRRAGDVGGQLVVDVAPRLARVRCVSLRSRAGVDAARGGDHCGMMTLLIGRMVAPAGVRVGHVERPEQLARAGAPAPHGHAERVGAVHLAAAGRAVADILEIAGDELGAGPLEVVAERFPGDERAGAVEGHVGEFAVDLAADDHEFGLGVGRVGVEDVVVLVLVDRDEVDPIRVAGAVERLAAGHEGGGVERVFGVLAGDDERAGGGELGELAEHEGVGRAGRLLWEVAEESVVDGADEAPGRGLVDAGVAVAVAGGRVDVAERVDRWDLLVGAVAVVDGRREVEAGRAAEHGERFVGRQR